MALLGARRKDRQHSADTHSLTSRLLPEILDVERLEKLGTVNFLDFGRANSGSLELFNQFPCRLCVLDTADALLAWSADVCRRAAGDEPPSQQQLQHELSGLLRDMGEGRYDMVFLWDTLNHLPEIALPAFRALLGRQLQPGSRGHGFILHKRDAPRQLRRMGLRGAQEIRLLEAQDAPLYAHTRKAVSEALAPALLIERAVLHGDGRLEYIMTVAPPR